MQDFVHQPYPFRFLIEPTSNGQGPYIAAKDLFQQLDQGCHLVYQTLRSGSFRKPWSGFCAVG